MSRIKIIFIILVLILFVFVTAGYFFRKTITRWFLKPTDSSLETGIPTTQDIKDKDQLEIVSDSLSVPWAVAVLPNANVLVTERTGSLKRLGEFGQSYEIEGVAAVGEGGLLGLTLHPNFATNSYLYLYLTTDNGDGFTNRIERYVYKNDTLREKSTILDNIPGANYHDGGILAFGPDGKLYAGTGDAGVTELAQDTASLAGKILRLNDDGSIPPDNPFGNAVYSYGHRNVQGITWDEQGRMWATEHGPSGTQSGYDELNLIESGKNYGWPTIRGDESRNGMQNPVVHSGADETWAPGGIAYGDGSLYFMGLRGARIYQAVLEESNSVRLLTHFANEFGRLRAATISNGVLYFTTSNTDGRGTPKENDDKLYSLPISLFNQ